MLVIIQFIERPTAEKVITLDDNKTEILSPRWIVPVVPRDTVLTDHSLVMKSSYIDAILPRKEALNLFPSAKETILEDQVMVPGFINTHGHAAMTLLRGLADDRDMMDWLTNWIWPIEGKLVDEKFVYDGTRLAVLEMIQSGTTCASDLYFFPEVAAKAITEMNFRAQVTLPVLKADNAWAKGEDEHIRKGLAFRDTVKHNALVTTAFAPHSPYSVTNQGFEKIGIYAEQLDMPIHLHLHETLQECEESVRDHGVRPIARMKSLGILSARLQAVHMTQLRDNEIDLVAEHGVQIAHCPESNLKLASGFCRLTDLRRAGLTVALGTDGAASNNDLDMIQEARSANMTAKAFSGSAINLSAIETLEMMTIEGARLLGLEPSIGSLEPGKLADITCIDLSHTAFQPIYNPVSQLIYIATGRDVSHVWINGRQLLKHGKPVDLDIQGIKAAATKWQTNIKRALL